MLVRCTLLQVSFGSRVAADVERRVEPESAARRRLWLEAPYQQRRAAWRYWVGKADPQAATAQFAHLRPRGLAQGHNQGQRIRAEGQRRAVGHRPGGSRLAQRKHMHGHQARSEEHTSELQSLMRIYYSVFCFEKNKQL